MERQQWSSIQILNTVHKTIKNAFIVVNSLKSWCKIFNALRLAVS